MTGTFALDIGSTVQSTVDRSVSVALRILVFVVILAVGWAVAAVVARLVDRVLERLRFNTAAVRSGLSRWTGRYRASELVARLGYYAVLLFALQLGFGVFGPNPVSDLIAGVVHWLPKAFVACVIVVVAASIGRAVYDIVSTALARVSYGPVLARVAQGTLAGLGVIAALNQVGVATTVTEPVLVTSLGTVGGILVVGLGGGLIQPMRHRWERLLTRAENDTARVARQLRDARPVPAESPFSQPAYQPKVTAPEPAPVADVATARVRTPGAAP